MAELGSRWIDNHIWTVAAYSWKTFMLRHNSIMLLLTS